MSIKEQIGNAKNTTVEFWKSQSKKHKIIFFSVLGGIILISVILAIALHKQNYAVLYTGLKTSECSDIAKELESMNVDTQVKQDGTILVPESQQNKVRMELATKGYPKSTFSYDIWTKNVNMFTTDSQTKQIKQMELQDRLAATISTLSDVDSAIVTLDIPTTSNNVLSTSTDKPTASVVLHLKDGKSLTSKQIKGITHIVAMAISGLDENSVSITDGNGNPLSGQDTTKTDEVVLETQKLKFKHDFEDALRSEVLNLLIPSYGSNGVKVSVNATLDYDKKVSEDTHYTPSVDDHGMVQKEEKEQSTGTNGADGGTVGVEPNADGTYPTGTDTNTDGSWSSSKTSTSYLVNTLKTQSEKQGYYVDKVSVSVVVYKDVLGQQEKQSVQNATVNAVGTTPQLVTVENLPKYQDRQDNNNNNTKDTNSNSLFKLPIKAILISLGAVAFIVILLLIIVSAKKRKRRKIQRQLAIEEQLLREQESKENEIKKLTENKPETKEAAIRREISSFAEKSPEVAAQLLKNWLREDEK